MNGLILVDKPSGLTSHDVVLVLRRFLAEPRVGHFGTLDPLATGLLVTALGKATRLFPFFAGEDKVYQGRIRFGWATDTYDAQGEPMAGDYAGLPDEAVLRRAMAKFEGPLRQLPPPFSAKKFKGQPLYKRARAGKDTPLTACPVVIHRFALLDYRPPEAEVEVVCSSGTYIRSLAHDLGRDLGCGAHLSGLRRLSSGAFRLENAFTLDRIREMAEAGQAGNFFIPVENLLPASPRIVLDASQERMVRNGQAVPLDGTEGTSSGDLSGRKPEYPPGAPVLRLFDRDGHLIALARLDASNRAGRPFLLFD